MPNLAAVGFLLKLLLGELILPMDGAGLLAALIVIRDHPSVWTAFSIGYFVFLFRAEETIQEKLPRSEFGHGR